MATINLQHLPALARTSLTSLLSMMSPMRAESVSGLLQRVDLTDYDSIASYLGIPILSEFPTAGRARTWGRDEWGAWAAAHGYESRGDTTHSWAWCHPYFQALVLSVAKTPSDFRTPMAMATQTRRAHRHMLDVGCGVALSFIAGTAGVKGGSDEPQYELPVMLEDIPPYWEQVRELIRAATATQFRYSTPVQTVLRDEHHTSGDVRQLLARILKESNLSPRQSLSTACEMRPEEAERVVKTLSTQHASASAPAGMFDALTDLLHQLREEDKWQREQQRAERAAEREAARAVEAAPVDEQTHTREQVQQVFDSRRGAIVDQLGAVMKAAQSTLDRARFALDQLPQFRIPALDAGGKVTELQAEVVQLQAAVGERDEVIRTLTAANAEASARTSNAKQDLEQLSSDNVTLRVVVQLVADTLGGCGSLNPMAFAQALETLRTEAQAALKATSHPPRASPPAQSAAA